MLTLLFRKMRNTKWMVICLLVGFIMASAMMSTIPTYMNASLQRMLIKDMEAFQLEEDTYPGVYSISKTIGFGVPIDSQREIVSELNKVADSRTKSLGIPIKSEKVFLSDAYLYIKSFEINSSTSLSRIAVGSMDNVGEHISFTQGRMYDSKSVDGVFEVIASEQAMQTTGMILDIEYTLGNVIEDSGKELKIKVVGVFKEKDENDAYWSEGFSKYLNTVLMDEGLFYNEAIESGAATISNYSARYALDYHNMDMNSLDSVTEQLDAQKKVYNEERIIFEMPATEIFVEYSDRAVQLKLVLWLLQVPVILMLIFYLFMVSQLNVEKEKNEIAVFKSRGASSKQILSIYAMESAFLGIITAVIGPFVGMFLCSILGVSNGFLEFVNRPALPIRLTFDAFLYSILSVMVFFLTTMIPIIPATKTSIVAHKQSKSKIKKKPLWQRGFFDFILIAVSVGWLYSNNAIQERLLASGLTDMSLTMSPFMFLASTAFILGCGLLFVRIYPLIVRIIYKIGIRWWSPAAYVSLNNIGRSSSGREKFLMIFLVLTVGLGLFSANTARALNSNMENRISYGVGADAVIVESWFNSNMGGMNQGGSDEVSDDETSTLQYDEPLFERFEKLPGVDWATKVFVRERVSVRNSNSNTPINVETTDESEQTGQSQSNSSTGVYLMTVIPDQFAQVANMPSYLLPTHINDYLAALGDFPSGIILSSSYQAKYGVELGDTVQVKWSRNEAFDATIIAFVDYWPGINPYAKDGSGAYQDFAVMNFDYVRVQTAVEPYQVWMNLNEDASISDFYQGITDERIYAESVEVASQQIVENKNDPMLQGLNGALTLGFIAIMVTCIIGFLIYWILSIKSRTLQFGILRAMGMSFKSVIALLLYEQLLVSGISILVAIVIGGIASDLFVPLFNSLYSVGDQILPFVVRPIRSDYLKLYAIVEAMLVLGFVVLGRIISKIKISQALKLGED